MTDLAWLAWLPASPLLRAVSLAALLLATTTLLLLAMVVVMAGRAARRRREREDFVATWRPRLAAFAVDASDDADWPPLPAAQRSLFLLLWNRLQQQLRGAAVTRLNLAFERLGLLPFLREQLAEGSTRQRLAALGSARLLGHRDLADQVAPLLAHPSAVLSLAAASALASLDPARAASALLQRGAQRSDWSVERLEGLAREIGPAVLTPPLLAMLAAGDLPARLRGLLRAAEPAQVAPWARARLEDPDLDEDTACIALDCLGALGDPRDREPCFTRLSAGSALVRHAAVRALHDLLTADDLERLLALLGDRDWAVRQAVARAIARLPGIDRAQLASRAEAHPDAFARDALRSAMAEAETEAGR